MTIGQKDSRIRVIHQENNWTLLLEILLFEAAMGNILFCTFYDFIYLFVLEKLYQALTESNADISMCGWLFCLMFKQIKSQNER